MQHEGWKLVIEERIFSGEVLLTGVIKDANGEAIIDHVPIEDKKTKDQLYLMAAAPDMYEILIKAWALLEAIQHERGLPFEYETTKAIKQIIQKIGERNYNE